MDIWIIFLLHVEALIMKDTYKSVIIAEGLIDLPRQGRSRSKIRILIFMIRRPVMGKCKHHVHLSIHAHGKGVTDYILAPCGSINYRGNTEICWRCTIARRNKERKQNNPSILY